MRVQHSVMRSALLGVGDEGKGTEQDTCVLVLVCLSKHRPLRWRGMQRFGMQTVVCGRQAEEEVEDLDESRRQGKLARRVRTPVLRIAEDVP